MIENFNPRSPYGERLLPYQQFHQIDPISIHAPHTGSDPPRMPRRRPRPNFNPRSPYGERRYIMHVRRSAMQISIHAPHTGSDQNEDEQRDEEQYFNPRSPYGERQRRAGPHTGSLKFQSTLPIRGATAARARGRGPRQFQSTLPIRGATAPSGCSPSSY